MADVLYRAHAFAPAETPVVLYGETGTGKTYVAEYIHELSKRCGDFHAFSVGSVAPQLALDELFGHVQGAYTDARKMRTGRIALAGAGTLLLDDLQNLDLGVQKQLLQVLDRGTYSPVGSDRMLTVGCRAILAMCEEPDRLVQRGTLLKDLRYRFGECAIRIPPLAERREEIPLLAQRFLEQCSQETKIQGPRNFSSEAADLLQQADYPGNARQLHGMIVYAYLMAAAAGTTRIEVEHLPVELCPVVRYKRRGDRRANRLAVDRALARTGGNVTKAAKLLGVSRNAIHNLVSAAPSEQVSSVPLAVDSG